MNTSAVAEHAVYAVYGRAAWWANREGGNGHYGCVVQCVVQWVQRVCATVQYEPCMNWCLCSASTCWHGLQLQLLPASASTCVACVAASTFAVSASSSALLLLLLV